MNSSIPSVRIQVNGVARQISPNLPLPDLLSSLGLPPQTALVELNGQALLRSEWPQTRLSDGDQLEILRVVAGG